MHQDIAYVLLEHDQITTRVRELAQQIDRDYADVDELLLVGVLKGSIMFIVDLARSLQRHVALDFIAISSYGQATETSGVVRVLKDLETDISGRHVVIVEDIVDSGLTLAYLRANLQRRNPASLRICALLDKPERRTADVVIDYLGFHIPNEFVVGYGLDYAERYRNLPYIGVLRPEVYRGR
ncbi:hypoxanthine phosphoribosyltransferase [Kallotenue papyrolyticum]|uniref:hypoxanthine phosphoribosyltransferase n=1 Tax=Kallotenue papyrolyticum TaxID=1325125 RepID=UPI0004785827